MRRHDTYIEKSQKGSTLSCFGRKCVDMQSSLGGKTMHALEI